jgi:hypothetical protein
MRHMNGRVSTYAYSTIVGGFLHLQVGMISLPISRREIDGYKVPSPYTTNFLQVLCTMASILPTQYAKTHV